MTVLAVAVSAIDTTWLVDNDDIMGGLGYPVRLVCEDETIEVVGAEYVRFQDTERSRWTVRRGVDGTTPAAHPGLAAITSGAITTGGGGGGGADIRLLGPFRVAFDDVGITGRKAVGPTDLPTGTVILRAWMQVTPDDPNGGDWLGPVGDVTAKIGIEDNNGEFEAVTEYYLTQGGPYLGQPVEYTWGPSPIDGTPAQTVRTKIGYVPEGPGHLYVRISDSEGTAPTQGEADVYAVVIYP